MDTFQFQPNSFFGRLLVESSTHLPHEEQERFFDAWQAAKNDHTGKLEIDGVCLPLHKTFEWLESNLDKMVKREAISLMRQKLEVLRDAADELTQRIEDVSQDLVSKMEKDFGLEHRED
jgi:hypothetical protein